MPFTPFHFGPGLFVKSIAKKFSFMIFIFSQIIIDLEPLYFILTNNPPLHRLFHTFLGANIVVFISVLIGKPICEFIIMGTRTLLKVCVPRVKISWPTAILTSIIGAYSHVFLDSLMHHDIKPFWPFMDINPLLNRVSISGLHWFCITAFAASGVYYLLQIGYKLLLNPERE